MALGCLALLLVVGACSESAEDADKGPSPDPSQTGDQTPTASVEGSVEAPASPGTAVDLGTGVVVPFVSDPIFEGDKPLKSTLQITVTDRVKRGPDQSGFNGVDTPASKVTYTVVNLGDTDLGGTLVYLDGYDRGRTIQGHSATTGGPCNAGLPTPFQKGDSADLCSLIFAKPGAIAAIGWTMSPAYKDEPVLWRLPSR